MKTNYRAIRLFNCNYHFLQYQRNYKFLWIFRWSEWKNIADPMHDKGAFSVKEDAYVSDKNWDLVAFTTNFPDIKLWFEAISFISDSIPRS